ncbi:unnamed protein product [Hymenolepis diminuta]|uniref:Uncharacterized protein n=1 Tax=Hymenolepis diminuta TaxID=6216 RepID=A0A564YMT3_HYMDI|nr:unnamed protein product [Hymenolepis diminuta]
MGRHTLVAHLLLRCPLIAFIPYHSPIRLNPHCGLINTFWHCRFSIFCPRTGTSCQLLVGYLTPSQN